VTPVERRFGGRSRGPVASSSNQTRARVLNVGIPLIFIPVTARPATAFPEGVWDCYSVCTDSGPISLWASWSMLIEAMNFGGMARAEDATMLGRVRCASGAIASTNPATKWTGEASFIRVPGFD
jgi:hypothetical protein